MKTILAILVFVSALILSSCGKEDSESFSVEIQSGCDLSVSMANCSSKNQKTGAKIKKIVEDANACRLSYELAEKYLTNFTNNKQETPEVRAYAQTALGSLTPRCGN